MYIVSLVFKITLLFIFKFVYVTDTGEIKTNVTILVAKFIYFALRMQSKFEENKNLLILYSA